MTRTEKTVILAFVGKGGVGKTSLAALTVRLLSEAYPDKRILAIDPSLEILDDSRSW